MQKTNAPRVNPYLFPFGLFCFGVWFFFDGWISKNPEMQGYVLFNRCGSVLLLCWAAIDAVRTRKRERKFRERDSADGSED